MLDERVGLNDIFKTVKMKSQLGSDESSLSGAWIVCSVGGHNTSTERDATLLTVVRIRVTAGQPHPILQRGWLQQLYCEGVETAMPCTQSPAMLPTRKMAGSTVKGGVSVVRLSHLLEGVSMS